MKAVSINLNFTNNTAETQTISFFNGGAQLDTNVVIEQQTNYGNFGGILPTALTSFEVTIGSVLFGGSLSVSGATEIAYWNDFVSQLNLQVPVATFGYIIIDPLNQDTWELTCTSNFSFGDLTLNF